jgi:putative mRNA 3-end processing factor
MNAPSRPSSATPIIELKPAGLYCPAGDFYVDPWKGVDRAVITHAHSDHARWGNKHYLATRESERVMRSRLGDISLQTLVYGESIPIGSAKVSLHPAGHVLGSAQVRIEVDGQVCVLSGDYKVQPDPTCAPFEVVPCHSFVTESTFGLPIYRWREEAALMADINTWWNINAEAGRASVIYAYSFGKAQRLLAGLNPSVGPIVCHGAVEALNDAYRAGGVVLPPTRMVTDIPDKACLRRAMVIAPPSAQGSPWLNRFGEYSDAFASGWMQIRGARRRRALDRGFVLSDHADWPGLLSAIEATGATQVYVTHGYVEPLVRWLNEHGIDGRSFETEFGDENDEAVGSTAADIGTSESVDEFNAGSDAKI